jgi:hypothetical protein
MKRQAAISAITFVLVLAATATGIFYRTDGSPFTGVSARGQAVSYQGSGLYKLDPSYFAREGRVWDCVNLFIGLPLFAIASIFAFRGSLRGKLFSGGLLAYFFYVYLGSAMMYALNAFFFVYVAIFALCIVGFVMNVQGIALSQLPSQFGPRFPRRLFIGFAIVLASALVVLWVGRVVSVVRTGLMPVEYAGLNTLGSQALDLGLVVPLALGSAVLLWSKSPWGYLLCSAAMTFGLMMFLSILAWVVVPLIQDGKTNLLEAIPFFAFSVVGIALAAVFYLNVKRRTTSG